VELSGWGRWPRLAAKPDWFESQTQLARCLGRKGELIAHGLGRSYGDSALNKRVVLTGGFDCVEDFDPVSGLLTCQSGVSLARLIEAFVPQGWFLAVTPGTKFVSVGGAIASDVHGKNHHQAGCFSQAVESLELMLPSGEVVPCSRQENRELFRATCGGMGLTGVILRARLRLKPIPGAFIRERIVVTRNLEETFQAFEDNREAPYSVAWIDCLARGELMGRSVLNLGRHEPDGRLELGPDRGLSLPLDLPGFFLNRLAMALFNQVNYRWAALGPRERVRHLEGFFYPLDLIGQWNRMYGRSGFTQYQLVLPKEASYLGLKAVLRRVTDSGLGAFLGVLKLLGPANDNHLSFPLEGYTLALDFKIQKGLFPFLDELDRVVLDWGGRLYLTKDARMRPRVFRQGYPHWEKFAELRERLGLKDKFNSLQSQRLGV